MQEVIIDGLPLAIVPGKYSVEEADRFGEKVSQGDLKYSDFNPYESAQTVSIMTGGAGLNRYSDVNDPSTVQTYYKETSNVNCSGVPAVLSPEVLTNAVPGATGPLVWIGEVALTAAPNTKRCIGVGPNGIWERASNGSWSLLTALPAAPRKNAVGFFNGVLVIGYGDLHTGQYTSNLTTLADVQDRTPASLYVWAFTADNAAAYIAGGSSVTSFHLVQSSATGGIGYSTPVDTGSFQPITSLAPGGGIAILYVGRPDELGQIDQQAVYHTLIPFDSVYANNCSPLKWWMGLGAADQRGPVVLVFPRGHGLWVYQPSTISAGDSYNISPWSEPWLRPPNAKGNVTAIQGSSRWLYFAVNRSDNHTYIYKRDGATGADHTWLDLGVGRCEDMTLTTLTTGIFPQVVMSFGTSVVSVRMPADGDDEVNDPQSRFQLTGTLDLPDIDLGFPDEEKIGFSIHVVADGLAAGAQEIDIWAGEDGNPLQFLGTVNISPAQEIQFPTHTSANRFQIRAVLRTNDPTKSPKLYAISVRASLNTKLYRLFVFQVRVPSGSMGTLADDLQNPEAVIKQLWLDRRLGFPVSFIDPWNDTYQARILKLHQQEVLREPDLFPEEVMDVTMLEVSAGVSSLDFLYDTVKPDGNLDQNLYGYDQPLSLYDTTSN